MWLSFWVLLINRSWFQGIDLSQSDYDGRTPLHLAAAEGRYECVNFLLKLVDVYPKPLDRYNYIYICIKI